MLIRDVSPDDLDVIRAVASARGQSLQAYLRSAVQAHAAFERRQQTLRALDEGLSGLHAVESDDRRAVLDAIGRAHLLRADELSVRGVETEQE